MSDTITELLDAAERHIREGGYAGFSFRDLADEIGIKSSSVHYHFRTKDKLAATVIERYTAQVSAYIDELFEREPDPLKVMATAFGAPVHSRDRLCPCVVLGAEIASLSPEVADKVKAYYDMWFDKLAAKGLPRQRASIVMASLLGGQLLSAIANDARSYDDVAWDLLRQNRVSAA